MIKNLNFSLIVILIWPIIAIYGQKENTPTVGINKYFAEALKNNSYYIENKVLIEISTDEVLKISVPYLTERESFVRYKAIDLIKRKGLSETNILYRQKIVSLLVEAIKETDSGNSGVASKSLTQFNPDDFNKSAKDSMLSLLHRNIYHFETVIKLNGFIQDSSAIRTLYNLKNDPYFSKKEKWAVDLALARLGDMTSTNYCLEKVKSVPVNDNVIYYLFPDLIYTRQKNCFDYILNELISDEKKCTSSNPDKEANIICAYKLMELVSPVIIDFPVKLNSFGELDITDYDAALLEVRKWIQSNNSYKIFNTTF